MSDLVKLRAARQRLGVSDSTMRRWLKANLIRGTKLGKQWFILEEEIERIKAHGLNLEVKDESTEMS